MSQQVDKRYRPGASSLTPRMALSCSSCCGGGGIAGSKVLNACVVMTILASPAKAFLPTLCSTSAIRRAKLGALAPASTPRNHLTNNVARQSNSVQRSSSRRSPFSLFAGTDGAKDAAMAAVRAAEEALNRAAEEAGAAAGAGEVQVTVAAARAAARNVMESLRRDERGLGEEGGRDVLTPRQDVVTSPARSAVQAALAAIAEAQSAAPAGAPGASSAAALDAVGMAQAALDRRDSAAAELGAVSSDDTPPRDESAGPAGGGPSHDDGSNQHGRTREPQSAHWSRNNPAASHSHMAHLLWRQVAGPGDTVLDCTAGNGHDSLELAKTVALKDGMGSLYIMDVQERALDATRERLRSELGDMALKRSTLINGNFREMPPELEPMSVQLVVYNLGWLPGGDKSITTKLEDTLESIEAAKRLVNHGGMISVMLYTGHAEGKRESEAVREYAAGLAHSRWRVFVHERINRTDSPELLTIYRL